MEYHSLGWKLGTLIRRGKGAQQFFKRKDKWPMGRGHVWRLEIVAKKE